MLKILVYRLFFTLLLFFRFIDEQMTLTCFASLTYGGPDVMSCVCFRKDKNRSPTTQRIHARNSAAAVCHGISIFNSAKLTMGWASISEKFHSFLLFVLVKTWFGKGFSSSGMRWICMETFANYTSTFIFPETKDPCRDIVPHKICYALSDFFVMFRMILCKSFLKRDAGCEVS